jgi:hypothetical protein
VYYKVLPGNADQQRFEDQVWRPMKMDTIGYGCVNELQPVQRVQVRDSKRTCVGCTADTTDKFKVFAIKVVIAGSSTVDVARLVNFRAIALDQ